MLIGVMIVLRKAELSRRQIAKDVCHCPMASAMVTTTITSTTRMLATTPGLRSSRPHIVFVAFATGFTYSKARLGRDDSLCRCVESLLVAGFDYRLVGWGTEFKDFGDKLLGVYLAAKDLEQRDPETIIIVGDAFDLLFNGPGTADMVLDFYLHNYKGKIVFGPEKNCWALNRDQCSTYPTPTRGHPMYRWLNAGFWMGCVADATRLLRPILSKGSKGIDDQHQFHLALLGNRSNVVLDYGSELILNMQDAWADLVRETHGWKNRAQGTRPFFIHHNGNGKDVFEKIEANQWLYHNHTTVKEFWANGTSKIRLGILPKDWRRNNLPGVVTWVRGSFAFICPTYFVDRQRAMLEYPPSGVT